MRFSLEGPDGTCVILKTECSLAGALVVILGIVVDAAGCILGRDTPGVVSPPRPVSVDIFGRNGAVDTFGRNTAAAAFG